MVGEPTRFVQLAVPGECAANNNPDKKMLFKSDGTGN
jgi:hypothetical protein